MPLRFLDAVQKSKKSITSPAAKDLRYEVFHRCVFLFRVLAIELGYFVIVLGR